MKRSVALIAATMILTGCGGSKRHADSNDIVVVRNDTDLHAATVEAVVAQERQTRLVTPLPQSGLETPPVASRTFTDTPLPPELAHLKDLGASSTTTASKPEERIP